MACRLERFNTFLHKPSRTGMTHDMRRDLAFLGAQLGTLQCLVPRSLDLVERLPVIVADIDGMATVNPSPALQMRQDTLAESHNGRSLVLGFLIAPATSAHGARLEVY